MATLIKEYDIPFIGQVRLLETNGGYPEDFYGKFYAESERMDENDLIGYESIEELEKDFKDYLKGYFAGLKASHEDRIKNYNDKIEEEKHRIGDLEKLLEKNKKNPNWYKEYRTKNPLQLEYQKK